MATFPDAGADTSLNEIAAAVKGVLSTADTTAETKLEAIRTLLAGTIGISAVALPLPVGAATKAEQEALLTAISGVLSVKDATAESKLATIATLLEGTLKVNRLPDSFTEGSISSTSGATSEVVVPIVQGMTMMVAWFKGTYEKATILSEISSDGGATYMVLFGAVVGTNSGTTQVTSAATSSQGAWEAAIPAGTTHFRARCTAITSGTVELKLAQGTSSYETAINATVGGSSNTLGALFSGGMWKDLSATTLGANATFTGSVIDVTAVATGAQFNNTTSNSTGEFRVSATSDKVGTLYLETSRDNTTYRRVKAVKAAQADATCSFYAELIHFPSERYLKPVYLNGAEAQTNFKCQQFTILGP